MSNGIFKLGWNELKDSITTAVFVAVVMAVGSVVLAAGFDAFSTDWGSLGRNVVNGSLIAFVGQLINNLVSDNQGHVFGIK